MYKRLERRQEEPYLICGSIIPRLATLRHIPTRYSHMLPLGLMKRYQCIVVGGEPGALTVAVTDQRDSTLFETLGQLTGCVIFPVLIDPERMRLLIRRIERAEREKHKPLNTISTRYPLHLHSMLMFLTAPIE